MQANEKKRPKDEKDIAHRLRPFARLQTSEDYEAFVADTIWEAMLRKRIQELQHYRRMGLTNAADIEKYELDVAKRVSHAQVATLMLLMTVRLVGSSQGERRKGLLSC
jgi:transcriptional adapter 2-alpha